MQLLQQLLKCSKTEKMLNIWVEPKRLPDAQQKTRYCSSPLSNVHHVSKNIYIWQYSNAPDKVDSSIDRKSTCNNFDNQIAI